MILLKEIREKKGYTQWKLSELSGVPQSTISAIECEERPNPGILTLYMLSAPLDCLPTDLVTFDAKTALLAGADGNGVE